MSKAVKHQLFRLIDSLSKAEKRNFKIFATRAGADANSKFIQLFDLLDRMNAPDDDAVMKRMQISNGQFSNLKRHLYQQLLTVSRSILRVFFTERDITSTHFASWSGCVPEPQSTIRTCCALKF